MFSSGDKASKFEEFDKLFNSLSSSVCANFNFSSTELLVAFFLNQILDFYLLKPFFYL